MKLLTQQDGKQFAIALLQAIQGPAMRGEFSAVAYVDDASEGRIHFPPQSPMIREAFDTIYAATEAARTGFFVVMSEAIGTQSTIPLSTWERWNAEGQIRDGRERN